MPRLFHLPTILAVLFIATVAHSQKPNDNALERLQRRAGKIALTVRNLQIEDKTSIPQTILAEAKAIIILRQYEAGFVFGARGGFGQALRRQDDGTWSNPAWIKTGDITGGLQIGVQTMSIVLLVMNDKGLGMLEKAKFRLGVDASVTAGPTGSSIQAKLGPETELLAYTESEGLYAGATFGGGFLLPDKKSNRLTYGKELSIPDVFLAPSLESPGYMTEIVEVLLEIEAGTLAP